MFNTELVKMNAYLPVKLAELSRLDAKATIQIIQAWGDGTKPLKKLWEETCNKLDAATSSNYN